eukprot:scaffold69543_cov29-Prasinocladus_malaysianus.AAC.1
MLCPVSAGAWLDVGHLSGNKLLIGRSAHLFPMTPMGLYRVHRSADHTAASRRFNLIFYYYPNEQGSRHHYIGKDTTTRISSASSHRQRSESYRAAGHQLRARAMVSLTGLEGRHDGRLATFEGTVCERGASWLRGWSSEPSRVEVCRVVVVCYNRLIGVICCARVLITNIGGSQYAGSADGALNCT